VEQNGEVRGPVADLTRALAEVHKLPFTVKPARGVPGVIETVRAGEADIGFIAFDPTRTEHVDFSQIYLLAHNSTVVPKASPIQSVKDLDKPGTRIGVGQGDSGDLFLTRNLKAATLTRFPGSDSASGIRMLLAGELDAYAANRTRLLAYEAQHATLRVLPDNFFSVRQAIIVKKGNAAALALIERFITEARASGAIQAAIDRAGIKGVDVAPAGMR
jgi:polar amino acid transport system substrate-binding protein